MHVNTLNQNRRAAFLLAVVAFLLVVAALGSHPVPADAQATPTGPPEGLVCTTSPNATFSLTTATGIVGTPDDNTIFMWGFAEQGAVFQHPSPVLCVNEGDTVTVSLTNTLDKDVSIMFPGQENVLANGAPAQPEFDGTTGAMTSLTNTAAAGGGTMTYSFLASKPGTYLYQSGTDPAKQARMGLFGVIVVRPSLGAQFAYNDPTSEFNTDDEVLVLLSEIDPYLNQAVEVGDYEAFDMNNYVPRYWMINGRGFPDSVADNFASWLPSQPYGALARVYPLDEDEFLADGVTSNPGYSPLPGLARYVSVGTETYPFHPHGNNGRVIGRDGNLLRDGGVAVGADLSFERFSIPVGPGQTWDVLYQWYDAEGYNGQEFLTDGTTPNPDFNPVTVGIPNFQNVVYGAFYSGSPYLGTAGDLPVGGEGFNQCGEYYIISHNHALYKITSWGVPMTGPITYLRIDPPQPNSCS